VDVLNETGFFNDILEHRREAVQSMIVMQPDELGSTDPIKDEKDG